MEIKVPRHLEDLLAGTTFGTAGRTVTEADIVTFAGLSGDYAPMHVDDAWSRANHPFGSRFAHGMLVASMSYALRTPMLDHLHVVAWLQTTRRFVAPVRPGDTVTATWTIAEARERASDHRTGVVTADIEVRNQDGVVVQQGSDVWLVERRPEEDR
ncbi:MaoC family dehydratase [Streptomyces cadmiisoli]|uniref:MaoC family dehydratase n=1 Tax=Streptomyces cadmiisoli TaxID=2184053 RepID=UPI003664043C